MNRHTKIVLCVLAIFVVGMTLGVAFADPVDAKTFKGKSKYKWKIKNSKWKKMKKKAKKEYKWLHKHGSSLPGYSKGVKVTVHKNGHKYRGTAYAVKNDYGIRCEVRGVGNGLHISTWGDYYQ
jgi:hypothetical protein